MIKNLFRNRNRKPSRKVSRKSFFEPLEERRLLAMDLVAGPIDEAPSQVNQGVNFRVFFTISNESTTSLSTFYNHELRLEDFGGQLIATLEHNTFAGSNAGQ